MTQSTTRIPFKFPFQPPSIALPLTPQDYLTRNLTSAQVGAYGTVIKSASTVFTIGSVVKILIWTIERRKRVAAEKAADDAEKAARAKQASGAQESKEENEAREIARLRALAEAQKKKEAEAKIAALAASMSSINSATQSGTISSSSSSTATSSSSSSTGGPGIAPLYAPSASSASSSSSTSAPKPPQTSDVTTEDDDEDFASFHSKQANPRRSLAPDASHIDSVKKKRRNNLPSGPRTAQMETQPVPPFKIGIITPRSLERYGELLKQGFDELIARNKQTQQPKEMILNQVELCTIEANEAPRRFAQRVRDRNFDVLLIQYHGANGEEPVSFLDYGLVAPRILLLHRPEEILERHQQHVFKDTQYNIYTLIREVECVVILGEAARPEVLTVFPEDEPANVCVVPHGFSNITPPQPRKLSPVVVGAITHWNDMRWLADLIQLNQVIQAKQAAASLTSSSSSKKKLKSSTPIVVYAAGQFHSYIDLHTKVEINELERLTAKFPDKLIVHTAAQFAEAVKSGEVVAKDVASLKTYLWKLSEHGKKVVVGDGLALFEDEAHMNVFDFSTQLYREYLKNFQPKIEYSGALHAHPGHALPLVFEGPSMSDIEIEGMTLITVSYPSGVVNEFTAEEEIPDSVIHAPKTPRADPSCPWYPSAQQCPDFGPAVDAMFRYVAQPATYQNHRQQTYEAAKELSMRHVATQYESIVKLIMGV